MVLTKAHEFAKLAHGEQKRKYTNDPYWHHTLRVGWIVAKYAKGTEDMVAAAFLHDVIEDTPFTENSLRQRFGDKITDLVVWLTDISRPEDGNRKVRKAIDRKFISNAPADAQTIKLADLIDNSLDIKKHDPKFAKVYLEEKRKLLQVLTKGDKTLMKMAMEISNDENWKKKSDKASNPLSN
jgi:(p)ppGpp synthase/HD superfamily hydrolase